MMLAKTFPIGKKMFVYKYKRTEKTIVLFRKGKKYNVNAKYKLYYPNIYNIRKKLTLNMFFTELYKRKYSRKDLPL